MINNYFEYLVKVNLSLFFVYIIFVWLYQNSHLQKVKRIYLLSGIAFSSLVPFFSFKWGTPQRFNISSYLLSQSSSKQYALGAGSTEIAPVTFMDLNLSQLIIGIYAIIVLALILRFLFNLIKLFQLKYNSKHIVRNGIKINLLRQNSPPFTFADRIYMSEPDFNSKNSSLLIKHELAHICQWHTLDIILIEVCILFLWFNPVIWLYRRAITETHEYLADQYVLKTSSLQLYKEKIVRFAIGNNLLPITSNFAHCQLNKRLKMMNKKESDRQSVLKYIIGLPMLIAMSLLLCSNSGPANNISLNTELLVEPSPSVNIIGKDRFGRVIELSTIKTEYTVLIFMDINCGKCTNETLIMSKSLSEVEKNINLSMLSVNILGRRRDWKTFIEENEPEFGIYMMAGKSFREFKEHYDIVSTPTIYVLDKDKNIISKKLKSTKEVCSFFNCNI